VSWIKLLRSQREPELAAPKRGIEAPEAPPFGAIEPLAIYYDMPSIHAYLAKKPYIFKQIDGCDRQYLHF
jgi:hypothetical protein